MLDHRPDRELRIQAASFGQGGLGLIDSAGIGVGRRQSRVNEKLAKAGVERLAIGVDRRVEKRPRLISASPAIMRNVVLRKSRGLSQIARSASVLACSKRPRAFSALARGI